MEGKEQKEAPVGSPQAGHTEQTVVTPGISAPEPNRILTDRQIRRMVRGNAFPNWKDILSIIGVFFASSLLLGFVIGMARIPMTGLVTFITYVIQFTLTITYAAYLTKQRTGTLKNVIHFSLKGFNPIVILWGLILMLAANVVIEPVTSLFPKEWYEWVNDHISSGGWAMVTAIVAAPICEEILFRGILQDSLVRKNAPWAGILTASLLFGLIHLIPQQMVAGFFLGIILGFVYYRTRSLLSVMVLHAINNALAVFLTIFESGDEQVSERTLRELVGSAQVYYVIYAICVILLVLSLVQVIRLVRRRVSEASAEVLISEEKA